jgi:hypothetical protein
MIKSVIPNEPLLRAAPHAALKNFAMDNHQEIL